MSTLLLGHYGEASRYHWRARRKEGSHSTDEGKIWTKNRPILPKFAWGHTCKRVSPGKWRQRWLACKPVGQRPIDCFKSTTRRVRRLCRTDDTVIPSYIAPTRDFRKLNCPSMVYCVKKSILGGIQHYRLLFVKLQNAVSTPFVHWMDERMRKVAITAVRFHTPFHTIDLLRPSVAVSPAEACVAARPPCSSALLASCSASGASP
jgi:hypothetical protein